MRIEIEIPKEFEEHFKMDKFADSLNRLYGDVHLLAGNYERELVEMLITAFGESEPAHSIDEAIEIVKFHRCEYDGIEWAIRDLEEFKARYLGGDYVERNNEIL